MAAAGPARSSRLLMSGLARCQSVSAAADVHWQQLQSCVKGPALVCKTVGLRTQTSSPDHVMCQVVAPIRAASIAADAKFQQAVGQLQSTRSNMQVSRLLCNASTASLLAAAASLQAGSATVRT